MFIKTYLILTIASMAFGWYISASTLMLMTGWQNLLLVVMIRRNVKTKSEKQISLSFDQRTLLLAGLILYCRDRHPNAHQNATLILKKTSKLL